MPDQTADGATEPYFFGEVTTLSTRHWEMTLKLEDDPAANLSKEMFHTVIFRCNLRDIDPGSVKVKDLSRARLSFVGARDYQF
jgi:hypothetical protein